MHFFQNYKQEININTQNLNFSYMKVLNICILHATCCIKVLQCDLKRRKARWQREKNTYANKGGSKMPFSLPFLLLLLFVSRSRSAFLTCLSRLTDELALEPHQTPPYSINYVAVNSPHTKVDKPRTISAKPSNGGCYLEKHWLGACDKKGNIFH
jgi:hypothetical protein